MLIRLFREGMLCSTAIFLIPWSKEVVAISYLPIKVLLPCGMVELGIWGRPAWPGLPHALGFHISRSLGSSGPTENKVNSLIPPLPFFLRLKHFKNRRWLGAEL